MNARASSAARSRSSGRQLAVQHEVEQASLIVPIHGPGGRANIAISSWPSSGLLQPGDVLLLGDAWQRRRSASTRARAAATFWARWLVTSAAES